MAEPLCADVGSLVRWKRGFQQNNLLDVNGLAVIMARHDPPIPATDVDPQSIDYGLVLDVELGTLDAEGQFFVFWTWSGFLESAEADHGCVAGLLRSTYAAFSTPHDLHAGQVVVWKPQCATPGLQYASAPGVLVELLEEGGELRPATSRDRGFRQPVDAAVAVEDALCSFRVVWTDRRCIAPYEGTVGPPELDGDASPEEQSASAATPPAVAARLLDRYMRMLGPAPLAVGELVRWKSGLRDRIVPLDSDAAVVLSLHEEPLRDPMAAVGSALWRQPLSVALGCMGEDGHFVICQYDARRFEPLPAVQTEHRPFLEHAYRLYRAPHSFRVGELVEWKPGLMNRNAPSDGGMAIVVEVPQTPRLSGQIEGSSPYFQEPLSLVVGVRDEDAFMLSHVDGSRFQPTESGTASEEGAWLRACAKDLTGPVSYAPGTVVAWKDGLCAYPRLDPEQHGVVLSVFDPPVIAATHSAGSLAFEVPHSLLVGFLDDEDQMGLYPVDGRRVRPAVLDVDQDGVLAELFEAYSQPRAFAPGQVVAWHPGLRGDAFLDLNSESPGIVLRHLDPPVTSPQRDLMASDFGARADLLVGGFDVDGDFAVIHADSRRLRLHPSQHGDAARRLRGFRRRLRHGTELRPGMIVAWKDCFCTQTALPNGIPGIVLDVLEKPVVAQTPSVTIDSPGFTMPWNTVVGVWSDTRLLRVHCDSRRLEPFDPTVQAEILQRRTTEDAQRMDDFSRLLEEFDEDDPPF
jgi:hypothetical protein